MKTDAELGIARLEAAFLPGNADLLCRIIDRAGIAMALFDRDGRCLYANLAFCRLTGYGPGECVGLALADFAHPEDRGWLTPGERAPDGDFHHFRRRDGSDFLGLTSLSPLDPSGEATTGGAILQIAAATERSALEGSLAEAEWRWRQALDGSKQVVWDFDVPNAMVWVSPRWRTMLGLADDERVHSLGHWLSRMHPDDRARLAEAAGRVHRGSDPDFDAAYRLQHSEGHWIWVLSRGDRKSVV